MAEGKTDDRPMTDAVKALLRELLPLATLATPNLDEAEILVGAKLRSVEDLRAAAREIVRRFGCAARSGYASENILKPDKYGIDLMSIGGVLLHSSSISLSAGENKPFTGGESGGAGASRKF